MTQKLQRRLRRHLIAGLIVIAPITATAFVLWWIFRALDGLLGRFLYPVLARYFPWIHLLPGLGILALLLILILVGWATERAIGSRIIAMWHGMLERFPLTRRIYGAAHSIVRTVFSRETRPFNKVVLVEFPSAGRWSIGFLAADAPGSVRVHIPDTLSVFVPTTPNPTTGYLVVVTPDKVMEVDMTMDQAFTYILSGGAVTPDAMRESAGRRAPGESAGLLGEPTGGTTP